MWSRVLGIVFVFSIAALAPAQTPPSDDTLEVSGRLAADDPLDPVRRQPGKVFEVKLIKGKSYQIDLVSDDFDANIRLVDAKGKQVGQDEDSGGRLNARIRFTPPDDQVYKIYASSFAGGEGAFTLRVAPPGGKVAVTKKTAEEPAIDLPRIESPSGAANVKAGEKSILDVNVALKQNDPLDPVRKFPCNVYQVALKKDVSYEIVMRSKEFDSFLRLESPAGAEVARDDDNAGFPDALIRYTSREDGDFKIIATTYKGDVGSYSLTVKSLAVGTYRVFQDLTTPTAAKPAQVDAKIESTDAMDPVRKRASKVFTVELKKGKTYQIDATSDQIDPFLRLENPQGKQLADDDDSGGDLNSRIVFACPEDGRYRIFVSVFRTGTGSFQLKVAEQP